jgi:diguanylate cyclase (GGDEF)-like protein
LEEQAVRDSLTNLHNRRYFLSTGEEVLSEHKKNGHSVSIIILDLDHFKNVNDTHGHSVGDEVLKSVADVLRSQCRSTDLISRYGGEEFIVLLPEMDQENAFLMAERFRTSIEDLDIVVGNLLIKITASFGVVSFLKGSNVTLELLINRADQALYLAKDAGRNQSIICEVSS